MDWAFVDRLRKFWQGKLIIKGIDTREDARMAVEHGFDGILVSNHGGRATETLRSTLEALPEVVAEARRSRPGLRGRRIPARHRRLQGASRSARRPSASAGRFSGGSARSAQAGVDRVIEILQGELKLAMGNCGTRTVADITRAYVTSRDRRL